MLTDEELTILFEETLNSLAFRHAPLRKELFKYLWQHRHEQSYGAGIWKHALQENATYNSNKNHDVRIRERCFDLSNVLTDRFAGITNGWSIQLPEGGPKRGYQLCLNEINNSQSASGSFWQAHLSPASKVALVYTEQLFFQDWPRHFIFRYYHLNAEQPDQALADLKLQHPEMYKEGLTVAHPYLSCGETTARDLIVKWFADHAHEKVDTAITRRMDDAVIAESSLILLRSPATNRMTADILSHPSCKHLHFSLSQVVNEGRCYGRVTIKKPSDEEKERLGPYNPRYSDNYCILDYSPEQGIALAILSRVRNPYADTAVTIFNADTGRSVEYMARFVLDETRMMLARKQFNWPAIIPESFEVLFAIPIGQIRKDFLPVKLTALAWRTY
jgi:hypothetical protein